MRVAQSEREHFQVRAVWIAPKDTARVRLANRAPLGHLHVRAAVANAEINFSVRAEMHAVRIVAEETHPHAEAIMEGAAKIGDAVAIDVAQQPEIGDVGIPHGAPARENAGAE